MKITKYVYIILGVLFAFKLNAQENTGFTMPSKSDIYRKLDRSKFLVNQGFIDQNNQVRQLSILTRYIEGLNGSQATYPADSILGQRFTVINSAIGKIFQAAFTNDGLFTNVNTVYEVKDSIRINPAGLSGPSLLDWRRKYSVCYERIVPFNQVGSLYPAIKNDLPYYFPEYIGEVQKRKMKCIALIRTGGEGFMAKKELTPFRQVNNANENGIFRGVTIKSFITPFQVLHLQHYWLPIVDETAYMGMIDIELAAPLNDIESLNKSLEKYGLKFVIKEALVDVLVISDTVKH